MCQFPTCIFNVYQVGDEFTVVGVLKMSILKRKPKTRYFLFFLFFFLPAKRPLRKFPKCIFTVMKDLFLLFAM